MDIWIKIANVANTLDENGMHQEADVLTNIIIRKAQTLNLQDWNIPVDSRMWPYQADESELHKKENDFWNQPRFRKPQYIDIPGGTNSDKDTDESIFAQNNDQEISGPAYVDQGNPISSPSMMNDMKQFEWDNIHPDGATDRWKNIIPRR